MRNDFRCVQAFAFRHAFCWAAPPAVHAGRAYSAHRPGLDTAAGFAHARHARLAARAPHSPDRHVRPALFHSIPRSGSSNFHNSAAIHSGLSLLFRYYANSGRFAAIYRHFTAPLPRPAALIFQFPGSIVSARFAGIASARHASYGRRPAQCFQVQAPFYYGYNYGRHITLSHCARRQQAALRCRIRQYRTIYQFRSFYSLWPLQFAQPPGPAFHFPLSQR